MPMTKAASPSTGRPEIAESGRYPSAAGNVDQLRPFAAGGAVGGSVRPEHVRLPVAGARLRLYHTLRDEGRVRLQTLATALRRGPGP
jgi:hypothetical protein